MRGVPKMEDNVAEWLGDDPRTVLKVYAPKTLMKTRKRPREKVPDQVKQVRRRRDLNPRTP